MLPVRTATVFRAKVSAIATGLGVSIVAVNAVTGLVYGFVLNASFGAVPRTFAAYWLTMAAAGTFIFSALLALQGLAALLLSYRLFLRASNLLQVAAFLAVLGGYFVTPGGAEASVMSAENRRMLEWFPSFWFLGLFQKLNGALDPLFGPLAVRALWGAGHRIHACHCNVRAGLFPRDAACGGDAGHRGGRPAASERHRPLGAAHADPFECRSRHRAVLCADAGTQPSTPFYLRGVCGVGLAITLAYSKVFLYGNTQIYESMRRYMRTPKWYEPNIPFLIGGFVMLTVTVIGARACFSLPARLKANWVFRVTAVKKPGVYFAAVRQAMYTMIGIPLWLAALAIYLLIWPAGPAAQHLVILAAGTVILIERSMYEFRKMPFACSYLPGKSNLKQKLAIYGILFMFVLDAGTRIEYWSFSSRSRFIFVSVFLLALGVQSRVRWNRFGRARYQRVQFQDVEAAEVNPLDLRRDGIWGADRAADLDVFEPEDPLGVRLRRAIQKAAIVTAVAAAFGAVYEQTARWQHQQEFPQIGQSVDIGGRSLNIFCSGSGSPTVVFESGAGGAGYGWTYIQSEVAKFTRACWYDRAGYGWSDAGPFPRDSLAASEDLHRLLRNVTGAAAPYVLVGASLGGFHVRVYAGRYPAEVAGLVLVDSSHVNRDEPIVPAPVFLSYAQAMLAKVLRSVGFLRMVMDRGEQIPPAGLTEPWRIASSFEPRTLAENAKEMFMQSALEARAVKNLGDLPLVVLTAGLPGKADNPVEARFNLRKQQTWIGWQQQLARLSSRGRQVVVEQSTHCIQCDSPASIIEAVREVVSESRGVRSALVADHP